LTSLRSNSNLAKAGTRAAKNDFRLRRNLHRLSTEHFSADDRKFLCREDSINLKDQDELGISHSHAFDKVCVNPRANAWRLNLVGLEIHYLFNRIDKRTNNGGLVAKFKGQICRVFVISATLLVRSLLPLNNATGDL
jgi:hypothetical protein